MSQLTVLSNICLRSPLLWGAAIAFCFFTAVRAGMIDDPNVVRYLAGHWVEYVEVLLFCVGLAALLQKLVEVRGERRRLDADPLPPIPAGGQPPADATDLLGGLEDEADAAGWSWLRRRCREALDLVVRTGSADTLEDHLKYLAEADAARASQSYGLVRFVIWAIPIMGFLGTVIGITVAIANLSPTQLENISGVVAGLGTAFDTTATALALSMLLMFLQFLIERSEQSVLAEVDGVVWDSLAGRFQTDGIANGSALAIAKIGEALGRSSARLLDAQEQSWRGLEKAARENIERVFNGLGEQLRRSLAGSLDQTLAGWRESLVAAQAKLGELHDERVAQAADALHGVITGLDQQQARMNEQTVALEKVAALVREVVTLERSLEGNLAAVTATGRFEETIVTLSAAVQLLAARAGDVAERRGMVAPHALPVGKVA